VPGLNVIFVWVPPEKWEVVFHYQLGNWARDCETFILRRKLCVVLRNGSYEAPFFSKNITEAHPSTWVLLTIVSELGWAALTTAWCPFSLGLNQPLTMATNFNLQGIKFVASGLGCRRRQSDLYFLDAHLSRFWGCSFMLALRETLSTYWIKSKSSRLQPRRRSWARRLDLSTILCHTALWGLFCEKWKTHAAPRATIANTSTCCCCSLKTTTTASNDVADDVNNNYWTPYCFAKSHVRRDKVVNFNSACSKILPPKSYFLEQCYHIQFTGIFHRGFCFTLDCSFEQCLIYLSFSKVVFHVGQG